jgi:hypothetical protein
MDSLAGDPSAFEKCVAFRPFRQVNQHGHALSIDTFING